MVSCQTLNSSKLSCMSSLPARMKMNLSKIKELEWSQHFPHYKSMCFSRRSREANFAAHSPIWPNFEPFQTLVEDVLKPPGSLLATDRSKAVGLV